MSHEDSCGAERWMAEVALARREASERRRAKAVTCAFGYTMVFGAVVWACLRWLV